MKLRLSDEELVSCVSCGLCLPHCPTYRVTGEERSSPRGRINAMRAVHFDGAASGAEFVSMMDECVQCRACEAVCPSAVPFGRLMEGARQTLVAEATPAYQPWWRRAGYRVLGRHRLLLALSSAAALLPAPLARRVGLPPLALRRRPLRPSGDDVWLFTGCVMDAWMRPTHLAVQRVLEAAGVGVALPGAGAACCGALALHAGLVDDARRLAERVVRSFPGDAPILVDSAGCGAALKDYGHLLGTGEGAAFSGRVFDVHEWLAARVDDLPRPARPLPLRVAVQDPCHLRHVQRAHLPVRTVLAPFVEELVELDDEGLCCGAGGAYAMLHPETAAELRDRKAAAVRRTGATVVASANPGCMLHLAGAGLDVRYPLEIVADALGTSDGR